MNDILRAARNTLWAHLKQGYPLDQNGETTFKLDEHNRPVLSELAHWMVDAPCETLVHSCGIGLAGPVGTGKTDIMRALSRACTDGFQIVSATEIVSHFNRSSRDDRENGGDKVILKWGKLDRDLCIDDLGEERLGQHFGKETDVIAEIIGHRYNLFKHRGIRTHFTTNIIKTDLMEERYGQRTTDRLMEMTRILALTGPSRRGGVQREHYRPPLFVLPEPEPTPEEQEANRQRVEAQVRRLQEALTPAVRAAQEIKSPAPTREQDLGSWTEAVQKMSEEEREKLREQITTMHHEATARPYLEVLDQLYQKERA